jgi:hypothetical protein
MITLNEIAYNIKNLAYGGSTTTENTISLRQIKHWIHYHRAKLIADNIDKGITNNEALYQSMVLTDRNSTKEDLVDWYKGYDNYLINGALSVPSFSTEYLLNAPKLNITVLNGEWLAISSVSSNDQSLNDSESRSFYGNEIVSSQVRGDFRNFGHHSFLTPRSLQLKNDEGLKNITIRRDVHFPDDVATNIDDQLSSFSKKGIQLYRKEYNNFDNHNRFTDRSQPYYTQENINQGHGSITFRGIQVSPNYHGGLNTPVNKKVFWKYLGSADMVLEDPTKINIIHGQEWDDDLTPYPIAMEYVSDLIQRVIQVEMQTELKTSPDTVNDGADDMKKINSSRGTQVQR